MIQNKYFMKESLAEFVKRIMFEKNLSGYDVERASKGEITQSYTNRIKNGVVLNPSPAKLKALAKGLGVGEEELFNIVRGKSNEPSNFEEKLLLAASGAENWTSEQRERFVQTVQTIAAGIRSERAKMNGQ